MSAGFTTASQPNAGSTAATAERSCYSRTSLHIAVELLGRCVINTGSFYGDCASSRRFFLRALCLLCSVQSSLEPGRGLKSGGALTGCFCALRHAAGGMPNWVMNQRVKELAME